MNDDIGSDGVGVGVGFGFGGGGGCGRGSETGIKAFPTCCEMNGFLALSLDSPNECEREEFVLEIVPWVFLS